MKNYLSFGGGVNSVALHLLLIDEKVEFESIFVHHGTDWPETYHYVAGFQWWLRANGHRPITVLRPDMGTVEGERFSILYDYYRFKGMTPSRRFRSCTTKAKRTPVEKYTETPCFMMIGIAADEDGRAVISNRKGQENRYPLIEREIDRKGCTEIIRFHGLPVPMRSGCFCCPFQSRQQFRELRRSHPDLFCKSEQLENAAFEKEAKRDRGKNGSVWLRDMPLRKYIGENQMKLFSQDEYPPCECGL